jgi:hypothetical protein
MNDLFDRIMDMPVRQRVLLLVGSVFLLFFLYGYLLYLPRNAEIDEKQENLVAERPRSQAGPRLQPAAVRVEVAICAP